METQNNDVQNLSPDVVPVQKWDDVIIKGESLTSQGGTVTPVASAFQSPNFKSGANGDGWRLDSNGNLEANDGNFRGDITGASGTFSGSLVAGSIHIPDEDVTANSFHVESDGDTWWGTTHTLFTADNENATAYILKSGVAKFKNVALTTSVSISGIANSTATDISLLELTHNITFSSSDADTVAWSSGTITLSNGRTFAISAGNTGNMSARTYIYLDPATSTTVLQTTTTPTTAHGANKITLAVAVNSTDKAEFVTYQGTGTRNILVDNIASNSTSTNEFVSNTAQIKNLIVTNAKINDLAVSKLTAGSITSQAITLAISGGSGDVKIQAGKTDFADDTAGFILGMDDSDSDSPKFEIGDSSTFLKYDPTNGLRVQGISQVTKSFTAGEPLAVGNTVFVEDSGTDVNRVVIGQTVNDVNEFGSAATVEKAAQSFVTPTGGMLLSKISLPYGLWKVGTPTDDVSCTVYADNGGEPDTVSLGSVTISGATLSAVADTAHTFTFATGISLPSGTFWFVLSRSGAMDGSNYYRFNHQNSANGDQYASGSYSRYISGVWTNINYDIGSTMITTTVTGRVYSASGLTTALSNGFIGFVKTAVSAAAASVPIVISGEVTGLSGISIGGLYYLSDSFGAISTSAGTVTRKAAIGTSSTTVLITNIW